MSEYDDTAALIDLARTVIEAVDDLKHHLAVAQATEELTAAFETSTLTPDYAYDPATGVVVPLSARAKYRAEPSEGYRHTQRYVGTLEDPEATTAARTALMERIEFGQNVYARRKELERSRKWLARKIGEPKNVVRALEYGDLEYAWMDIPLTRSSYLVETVAFALDTTVDALWPQASG